MESIKPYIGNKNINFEENRNCIGSRFLFAEIL